MCSSLLESVIVTEFRAAGAYSSFNLTKAKYSISRLSKVEKENVIVLISPSNFSACQKIKSIWQWKWSLQSICSPKSLIQSVRNVNEFPSLYRQFRTYVFLEKEMTLILWKLGLTRCIESAFVFLNCVIYFLNYLGWDFRFSLTDLSQRNLSVWRLF
jgi:hypothetical protein